MTRIAPHITAYLRQRLPIERRASANTCDTYAYAFQLLFEFASTRLSIAPSDLDLEHIDTAMVLAFLENLQATRGNGTRTRNARLAAIRSFMRFVEHRVPSALDQIRGVLAIPAQRADTRLIRHLEAEETKAILDAPNASTRDGTRDRALLYLAITGGLRVSELIGVRLDDVTFRGGYADIVVRGKGRRERILTVWKTVADGLCAWLSVRPNAAVPQLFLNARGAPLTRSGVEYILRKHVRAATKKCDRLSNKKVSPHVLRHTCAVNTLRATGDIRKVALWLGHASPQTTEVYLQADPVERLEILHSVLPPALRPGKFRPGDRLIAALHGK